MGKNQDNNGKSKLKRKEYEKELVRLQAELCKLQEWVKHKGLRLSSYLRGATARAREGPSMHHRTR